MSGSTEAQQKTTRHWIVAAGAFLAMIGASVLLSGISFLHPYIVTDLYVQKDAAGQVVTTLVRGIPTPVPANGGQSAFLLYFTIMTFSIVLPLMFISGKLYAKYGARTMLAIGAVTMSAGMVLYGLSSGSILFYIAGAIIGVGYGLSLALIAPALINTWFVARKGLVLGIVLAATGVGGFVWSIIIPRLAVSNLGWRGSVFIMAGVLLACAIIPVLFMIKDKPSDLGLVPYGASAAGSPAAAKAAGRVVPGFTYNQAVKSKWFWIACAGFFVFGMAVAVTQVLSIAFKTAAYPNPIDKSTWTQQQVAFYSSLFMIWTVFLIVWKPALGWLNDKIGLVRMMIISLGLMALAYIYMPSMIFGSSVLLMYVAMVAMSAGISNATVTPPLVIASAMGGKDYGRIFSLAVAFYYAGNAIGAPLWGALGNAGQYSVGMYAAPILLAFFVIASTLAASRGKAEYMKAAEAEKPLPAEPKPVIS